METVLLDDVGSYEALWYTWGNASQQSNITTDETDLPNCVAGVCLGWAQKTKTATLG
jgi:hypothetical protein